MKCPAFSRMLFHAKELAIPKFNISNIIFNSNEINSACATELLVVLKIDEQVIK